MLGSRKLRQWAQAFTKPEVQLVYGFVPGFQGFLCKYSHSAVSHLWLHLHLYKRVEQQSCTGKATQQHRCSWVGYRCRSRAARHEWTSQNSRTPLLHRVEAAMHEGLSLWLGLARQPGRAHTTWAHFPIYK